MPNGILTDYDTSIQRKLVDAYVQSRGGTTKGKTGVGASRAREALLNNPELVKELMNEISPDSAMNSEGTSTVVDEEGAGDSMSVDDKLIDVLHKRTQGNTPTPKSMGKGKPASMNYGT